MISLIINKSDRNRVKMILNQKKHLRKLLKHLKKLLISILFVVLIWYIIIGIIFPINPNLHCRTMINEDITWEIETHEPIETDPGAININFVIKYEVWINTPLPFLHSFDGCHLKPKAEAILTNSSLSDEKLFWGPLCYLAIVPALYTPGITNGLGSVHFFIDKYTFKSGLPEGLYTFWIDFGDLGGREGTIESYKTYLNVSDDGISVYSDDIVDYSIWFWEGFITSIVILTGSILIVYIGLVEKDRIIRHLRKKW
jgi:hypothetical protein